MGDSGTTWATHNIHKVAKNAPIIEFYGCSDKVIAYTLIILTRKTLKEQVKQGLGLTKQTLFDINTSIAIGQKFNWSRKLSEVQALIIATEIHRPTKWALTFNTKASAQINYLRALIRETERRYYDIAPELREKGIQKVLNRLSTLAFNLALFQDESQTLLA